MDIGSIDSWANNWDSYMHRASAWSKVLATALVLVALVVLNDFFILLAIYLVLLTALTLTRLPLSKILLLDAYPGMLATLFAISRWDGTVITPATVILRAMLAALMALLLIVTTPYPAIFAVIHRFLPGLVGDGLFLTYRALFVLLDLLGDLFTALKLRGGLTKGRHWRNITNMSLGLGLLLVRALSLSQKIYNAMHVRGYSGHLASPTSWQAASPYDTAPIALGLFAVALAVLSQRYGQQAAAYNGYLLMLSLVTCLTAFAISRLQPAKPNARRRSWRR